MNSENSIPSYPSYDVVANVKVDKGDYNQHSLSIVTKSFETLYTDLCRKLKEEYYSEAEIGKVEIVSTKQSRTVFVGDSVYGRNTND